eukprot:3094200-Rhodomonas_salina.1
MLLVDTKQSCYRLRRRQVTRINAIVTISSRVTITISRPGQLGKHCASGVTVMCTAQLELGPRRVLKKASTGGQVHAGGGVASAGSKELSRHRSSRWTTGECFRKLPVNHDHDHDAAARRVRKELLSQVEEEEVVLALSGFAWTESGRLHTLDLNDRTKTCCAQRVCAQAAAARRVFARCRSIQKLFIVGNSS